MSLSKKKIAEINSLSFISQIIKSQDRSHYIGGSHWIDTNPEMWMQEEKNLFDICIALEDKIKESIIELLTKKSK